jgi:hypothetical protein
VVAQATGLTRHRYSRIVRGGSPEPPRQLLVAGAIMRHSFAVGQETRRANRNLALSHLLPGSVIVVPFPPLRSLLPPFLP